MLLLPLLLLSAFARADAAGDFRAALARLDARDYAAAARELGALTEAEPANALYWFNLGSANFNLGDLPAALAAFDRVIALRSPLAPGARLCRIKCLRRQGSLDAAAGELARLRDGAPELAKLVADESKALAAAYRARGTAALGESNDAGAIDAFEASLAWENSPDAHYGLGMALLEQGRRGPARERFEAALATAGTTGDEAVRRDSRYFIERIDANLGAGAAWLALEAGAGVDTNLFLDGASGNPTVAPIAEVTAAAGAEGRSRGFFGRLSGTFSAELPFAISSGRFISQTARLEGGYDDASWSFKLSPGGQYQISGTTPYALRALAGALAQRNFGREAVGVQYEYGYGSAQSPEFAYVSGNTHWLAAYYEHIGQAFDLKLSYAVYVENIGDEISDGASLPLKDVANGPSARAFWLASPEWELGASVSYLWRSYANVALPGGATRSDGQWSALARVDRVFSPAFSVFGEAIYSDNSSTLGATSPVADRNYTQLIAYAGISWKPLR